MIVGLVPLDSGEIFIEQHQLTMQPMHIRARHGIGYLPQESSIFRKLSVFQNIMAILQMRKELDDEKREELSNELIDEFNLNHIRQNLGMSLSEANVVE